MSTCDKRKPRTYIASSFPHFVIEEGFTELDELWSPTVRESTTQVAERARKVLDDIFQKDIDAQCKTNSVIFQQNTLFKFFFVCAVVSITAHEGFMHGFLAAIGRQEIRVPTGGKTWAIFLCNSLTNKIFLIGYIPVVVKSQASMVHKN